jgi:hypothetical protein
LEVPLRTKEAGRGRMVILEKVGKEVEKRCWEEEDVRENLWRSREKVLLEARRT